MNGINFEDGELSLKSCCYMPEIEVAFFLLDAFRASLGRFGLMARMALVWVLRLLVSDVISRVGESVCTIRAIPKRKALGDLNCISC